YADASLNEAARTKIADWREARSAAASAAKGTKVAAHNLLPGLAAVCAFLALLFGVGIRCMGGSIWRFCRGFPFVFAIAVLAYMASQQALMREYGIGYAAWAILFGMLISNTVGTPRWVVPAVQTEFFIKAGLVLLGAEILFGKIVTIGIPGIFVAWLVTPVVLIFGFIIGDRWLKMPSKTLNVTICAAASVCGVSAAIATAAACRAKKEELTLAVGLSLIFTSLMMIGMPAFIKAVGMGQVLGGAWMGGTIDATGAVAAAGAFLGEKALYTSATIKMIQNVMIGVVAFGVALYWTMRVERRSGVAVGKMEIWYRFPKFVLGFVGVSIVFSIIYGLMGDDAGYTLIDHGVIRGGTKLLRGWLFCLAFVSIGLATNFRELADQFRGGKPLILYAGTQGFNLLLTLLIAWLAFYKVFPHITEKI
ncbi:YeiH family protein, partial [bacterium]|nr:YeiH family protein [bacterium]